MIKNFFNVAGADAVKRIAEWIRHKFYTKAEIDEMFSAGAKYEVVDELPSTGVEGTIYLVPSSTSPSGDIYDEYIYVEGNFEKIGTTKADLANVVRVPAVGTAVGDTTHPVYVDADGEATAGSQYAGGTKLTLNGTDKGADSATAYAPTAGGTSGQYLKSNGNGNAPSWETMDTAPTENSTKAVTSGGVKTALDGKQASVTITTNANTPTDNDTVIMQDNGNTGTTSFLRRKLSTLWNYFKGKADGVYVPFAFVNLVGDGGSKNLWDNILDGKMWGADQRFNVTWVSYDIESGEVVETKDAKNLFNMADNYYKHPITGEKDIITISPKDGLSSSYLWTYCHGYYYLNFYSTKLPESATLRWKQRNSDTWNTATFETFGRGNQAWRALIPWGNPNLSTYVNTIEITIIGKTDSEVAWPGTSVCNLTHICTRETLGERGVVTKYAYTQSLYGNIVAPKFQTRGGTSSQFVLGDGTLQNSPIPISKGGTGATTAIGAEYNILNQVANMDNTSLSDDRRFAICNQTKSASNGVFRWYKLSSLWTWIKTHFDSSPTSGSGNGITSGGVYSALEEKVNLQPDFTAQQISYSAGNVGKWQKVLRFPEGADLVINMKKTAMGSDSTSTLWFSSSSMGDSYTSLFGNHSVRFIHDGGYVFLVLACKKSTYEPTESYTFQIAHSSVPMSDIVAVTDASPVTATPKEPNIVYRAPITTGAVSFNVTNGAGSVAMANHNDFLGNMTAEATNGVVVTMSGATEGQIYRFVFTRNIEGGVTFKQSNVAYCTIQGDVNAGDTITLTAVSNTADGWLYEQESAGIKSSDGSINVEYEGSTADLSLNLPPDVVKNNEWTSSVGHRVIAIGDGASADTASNNVAIGKDADASGNSATCVGCDSEASGTYSSSLGYNAEASAFGAVAIGGNAVANGSGAVAIGGNQPSQATTSAGYSVAIGGRAIAPSNSVVIGHNANGGNGSYGTTIGKDAESSGSYTCAVGFLAKANNNYAIAIGMHTEAGGFQAIAIGPYASTKNINALALGYNANANQLTGGYGKHELISFNVNNESKKVYVSSTAETISIEITGIGTFAGIDMPADYMLFVLSEELEFANELLFEVDGIVKQKQDFSSSAWNYISVGRMTALGSSGYYAYTFPSRYIDYTDINTSTHAYFFATSGDSYNNRYNGISIGSLATSIGSGSIAIGNGATSIKDGQIVIGQFNAESGTDLMQVGNGTAPNRKNILTIDSNERLKVCSYVGETQTIDMNQQTGTLSNITKAVYKIKWDGTGTIRLTLGTDGCVEGQRVSLVAVTNDVLIFGTTKLVPLGTFGDFLFLDGAWIPSSGVLNV